MNLLTHVFITALPENRSMVGGVKASHTLQTYVETEDELEAVKKGIERAYTIGFNSYILSFNHVVLNNTTICLNSTGV